MSEKVYEPIAPPVICEADPRANLSDTERDMYNSVLEHFSDPAYQIPTLEKGELTEAEQFWLSCECLLRYLRATKWKSAAAAIQRLDATLKWRREYGIYEDVSASFVEPEAVTGKQVLFGYDSRGRPGLYLFPSRQNTVEATRQIQFTVWMLERTVDLMGPGVETLDLLINYGDKSKNPSLGVARTVLNILQDHYPERLGAALILNVPFLLNAFYKLINPFIDPVSREKMKFNPQVVKDNIFTGDMVMAEWWGGDRDFEYCHDKYWPALVGMCESRRQNWLDKWKALGGKVGVKEWDYKGGAMAPVVADEPRAIESEKVSEAPAQGMTAEAVTVT
ncbi:CRAL-TRIO domain-containing protein [Lyophyllum atratum]|nr:CRAL-TRIO domain-containing protein [Lyophyllum atratum]